MMIAENALLQRRVVAMLVDSPHRGVVGVCQCALSGCDWSVVIDAEDEPGDVVLTFCNEHECGGAWEPFDPAKPIAYSRVVVHGALDS